MLLAEIASRGDAGGEGRPGEALRVRGWPVEAVWASQRVLTVGQATKIKSNRRQATKEYIEAQGIRDKRPVDARPHIGTDRSSITPVS